MCVRSRIVCVLGVECVCVRSRIVCVLGVGLCVC